MPLVTSVKLENDLHPMEHKRVLLKLIKGTTTLEKRVMMPNTRENRMILARLLRYSFNQDDQGWITTLENEPNKLSLLKPFYYDREEGKTRTIAYDQAENQLVYTTTSVKKTQDEAVAKMMNYASYSRERDSKSR